MLTDLRLAEVMHPLRVHDVPFDLPEDAPGFGAQASHDLVVPEPSKPYAA